MKQNLIHYLIIVTLFSTGTNMLAMEDQMSLPEQNLRKIGLELPQVSIPVANYAPFVNTNNIVFISGQLPMQKGKLAYAGKVGETVSIEDAKIAASVCALNILAQLKAAVGSLDKVKRCIKLTGFVNSTPDFAAHPQVINGASDLLVSVFGDKGKHARAAVGVSSLPFNAAVEVEAIFEVE